MNTIKNFRTAILLIVAGLFVVTHWCGCGAPQYLRYSINGFYTEAQKDSICTVEGIPMDIELWHPSIYITGEQDTVWQWYWIKEKEKGNVIYTLEPRGDKYIIRKKENL